MAYVFLLLAVVFALAWDIQAQQAQQPSTDPFLQCQAGLRVEQHLAQQAKQLSMELLLRAEQLERQLAEAKKQLELLQHPPEAK